MPCNDDGDDDEVVYITCVKWTSPEASMQIEKTFAGIRTCNWYDLCACLVTCGISTSSVCADSQMSDAAVSACVLVRMHPAVSLT